MSKAFPWALSALVAASACGALGQKTAPRKDSQQQGQTLETSPPNVPEFKPAFAGQTRAPLHTTQTKFRVEVLASGLDHPWAVAFLPDGRMLVTEKPSGTLRIVQTSKPSVKVAGVPKVDGREQGGLLDVELAPDHAQSRAIYLSYYEPRGDENSLAVARATLVDGPTPKLENLSVVFRMEPAMDSTKHAGGRMVFAPDGNLFVTLGERSIMEGRKQARDLNSHLGKIVRIQPDGKVPADNPYVGKPEARPEIWTSGHRNILSAALDAQKRLWIVEMGPRGGDELNLIEKGKDYGWPTIGYGEEYSGRKIHERTHAPGLEQPVYYWDPVISPSGMAIYTGKAFPAWKGNIFIGGLSSTALVRLVVEKDRIVGEERLLTDRRERIREVVEGPDGALYLLTDDDDGKLLKLSP